MADGGEGVLIFHSTPVKRPRTTIDNSSGSSTKDEICSVAEQPGKYLAAWAVISYTESYLPDIGPNVDLGDMQTDPELPVQFDMYTGYHDSDQD